MTGGVLDSVGARPDDTAVRETIRRQVEAAGTSFYWAMRLLPEPRRDGMYAIYAFCRQVDDIADETGSPECKQAALAGWHAEIDALYAGRPRHLVARALRDPVVRYQLRREDFHAVICGMEMDAAADIRAPDLATLDLYCGRVAAAVGHLSVHVFGDPSPAAHAVADALGRALQLTNILRDLDEDARRHPALPAACRDLAAIAEQHFTAADRAMAGCSRRAMRPAAVMSAFYRATLDALLRSDWRDPGDRVSLSRPRKLWLVLRHGLL